MAWQLWPVQNKSYRIQDSSNVVRLSIREHSKTFQTLIKNHKRDQDFPQFSENFWMRKLILLNSRLLSEWKPFHKIPEYCSKLKNIFVYCRIFAKYVLSPRTSIEGSIILKNYYFDICQSI